MHQTQAIIFFVLSGIAAFSTLVLTLVSNLVWLQLRSQTMRRTLITGSEKNRLNSVLTSYCDYVCAAGCATSIALIVVCTLAACRPARLKYTSPESVTDFFPLTAQSRWIYDVNDKSQAHPFTITDTVIGQRYIPSLNLLGTLVDEYCSLEGADEKTPIMFFDRDGYLVKVSALVYSRSDITAAPFGVVRENKFLPIQIIDEERWNDEFWPSVVLRLTL